VAKAGDVLEIPELAVRIEFRRTAAETDGELVEYDVIGRPRGFVAQQHVHSAQVERNEVLSGAAGIAMGGTTRTLGPGDSVVVPAGTAHRHLTAGSGDGHVRVELRPALQTEEFLERLAALSQAGQLTAKGWLRPVAAARLMRDFETLGHATRPPLAVQRAFSRAVLGIADRSREYVFVDEWDVDAPVEAVFDAIADARTYPMWWQPVYREVEAEGPPQVGQVSHQHFKGRLPYHLHTTSRITRIEPPHLVVGDVEGDLRGRGVWTLSPNGGGTHVRFDWTVHADRALLRTLTPLLRPVFRWNHNWAIARAMAGLEPYARRAAALR
jgi:uncharacterized protein YndB with AHSA1/START domain/quercetin dioxygenase-like cupin family protein